MKYLFLLLFIFCLIGCSGVSQQAAKTSDQVSTLKAQVNDLGKHSRSLDSQVLELPDAVPQKAGLSQTAKDISQDHTALVKTTGGVEDATKQDAKTIAKDKKALAANPVRDWLYLIGVGFLTLGITCFVLSIFLTLPTVIKSLSFAFVVIGPILLTIAYFLTTIEWIIGATILAGIIGGLVWLWAHRTMLLPALGAHK